MTIDIKQRTIIKLIIRKQVSLSNNVTCDLNDSQIVCNYTFFYYVKKTLS